MIGDPPRIVQQPQSRPRIDWTTVTKDLVTEIVGIGSSKWLQVDEDPSQLQKELRIEELDLLRASELTDPSMFLHWAAKDRSWGLKEPIDPIKKDWDRYPGGGWRNPILHRSSTPKISSVFRISVFRRSLKDPIIIGWPYSQQVERDPQRSHVWHERSHSRTGYRVDPRTGSPVNMSQEAILKQLLKKQSDDVTDPSSSAHWSIRNRFPLAFDGFALKKWTGGWWRHGWLMTSRVWNVTNAEIN